MIFLLHALGQPLALGICSVFLGWSLWVTPNSLVTQTPDVTLATLPGLGHLLAGQPPETLGVNEDAQLSLCPASPNCVLSQATDEVHAIAPLTFGNDRQQAYTTLLKVLSVVPRTDIIETTDTYIRVEFTSNLLGFVDDGEFYFPEDDGVIQVRSASRLGESDLGVNRRRIEQIRLALQDLAAS